MKFKLRAPGVRPAGKWLICLFALSLAACAAAPPKDPAQAVTERAMARWEAMLAGDFETAYGYYSPGYRSSHTREAMRTHFENSQISWKDVSFDSITCREKVCRPAFFVSYQLTSPLPMVGEVQIPTRIEEEWLYQEGQWWYVPDLSRRR